MTMALSAIESDIRSGTRFSAVGLIEPRPDGRVRFELHAPLSIASSIIDRAQLQPGGAIEQLSRMWDFGPPASTPVGADGLELFGSIQRDAPAPDDRRALEGIARRLEALAAGGEPGAVRERRLSRNESLADVLSTLSGVLDIRDVFDQLSATARQVLPHDFATVFSLTPDRRRVHVRALSLPPGAALPPESDNPYPHAMTDGVNFALHHDLAAHPFEKGGPAAAMGLRSSIRMPVRLDGVLHSVLDFSAFRPNQYTAEDLAIARRIADYVTLAFSHQKLADEARDAAALRARAANVELLDELVATLGESGELSETFGRISAIAKRVLPHDLLGLPVLLPDGVHAKVYARSGDQSDAVPDVIELPAALWTDRGWEYDLRDDIQTHAG